ncbi:MAG TPA: carboxypeptidase regulatory-like domain-containing protein [Bryobacteraceae bacterium]|jgi:tetratricopeptide (TPR) repeat protein
MFATRNATTRKMMRSVLIPVAGLILFSALSFGQTTQIEGDVKGEDGAPLKGAWVKIDRTDITGHYKVKTDKKGHYFHAGLPFPGTYNVSVEVDDKVMDMVKGVRPGLGEDHPVDFDLSANKRKQAALNAAVDKGTVPAEVEKGMSAADKAKLEKSIKERQAQMSKNKALNDAFNAGREALAAKDYQTALDKFKAAAEMDPKQHVIWGNMADAYIGLAAKATGDEKTKNDEGAVDAYKKALELKADDAAYHNNYGLLLARMKKFDDAQTELKTAAALDAPNAGKYFFNLGAVLVNGGNYGPAEEAFKQAIAADPNYADAYYQYGVALMAKATTTPDGKVIPPPGTAEAFQKYLELKPDGKDAEGAKGMLAAIGSGVQTNYQNPDAKKKPVKKK